ncbi:MAG: hypothetical protein QM796_04075 [Chthoniobacteraceae bacterium]
MLLATCLGVALLATMQVAQPAGLCSRIIHVHDPSTIIRGGDEYWLYATVGDSGWHSPDLVHGN